MFIERISTFKSDNDKKYINAKGEEKDSFKYFNTDKLKAAIKEISALNQEEAPKEVKFWLDENGNEDNRGNGVQKNQLQQTFKYIYEENYVDANQRKNITEFFGNAVIAAVMESLINLSVDEIDKFKQKDKNLTISPW